MSNRRDCCKVIQQMLRHIPSDRQGFIMDLQWNLEDSFYKAPEENIQWIRTSETLQKHIPLPTEDWEFQVVSIFSTISIEEINE